MNNYEMCQEELMEYLDAEDEAIAGNIADKLRRKNRIDMNIRNTMRMRMIATSKDHRTIIVNDTVVGFSKKHTNKVPADLEWDFEIIYPEDEYDNDLALKEAIQAIIGDKYDANGLKWVLKLITGLDPEVYKNEYLVYNFKVFHKLRNVRLPERANGYEYYDAKKQEWVLDFDKFRGDNLDCMCENHLKMSNNGGYLRKWYD